MKKFIKNNILGFIMGAILFGGITVYAAYAYSASQISYKTTNVEAALNDLYGKSPEKTSTLINSISVTPSANTVSIDLTVTSASSDNIIAYHAYAVEKNDSSKVYYTVSNNSSMTISSLTRNTEYKVYVVAYDKYNNYVVSEKQNVTTMDEIVKLVPTLTSNTSGGGTALAQTTHGSAWNAFDGKFTGPNLGAVEFMDLSSGTNTVGYDFGENNQRRVTKVVYYGSYNDANCRFTSFTLQYSDNGTTWTNVQSFNTVAINSYNNISDLAQSFDVTNTTSYHRYWRIDGTNSGHSWSGLLELEFWGF